jgi:hypothetical protein
METRLGSLAKLDKIRINVARKINGGFEKNQLEK